MTDTQSFRVTFIHALGDNHSSSLRAPFPVAFASAGIPTLCDMLDRHGYHDLRSVDLNVKLLDWTRRNAPGLDISPFSDTGVVDEFLTTGAAGSVSTASHRLLDIAGVGESDLFGLSLALQGGSAIPTHWNLNLCLIRALKDRYPKARTAIGGLIMDSVEECRRFYCRWLERCPSLDYAVEGPGEVTLLQIVESLSKGITLESQGRKFERHGNGYYFAPQRDDTMLSEPARSIKKPETIIDGRYDLRDYMRTPVGTPIFLNAEEYRVSGHYLADAYKMSERLREELAPHLDRTTLPLCYRFTEGCVLKCAFCVSSMVAPSARPIPEVIETLRQMSESCRTRDIVAMNNCINWSYEYASEFADALIASGLDLLWTDSLVMHLVDEPLIAKLQKSGFIIGDTGVESGSERMRKRIGKPLTNPEIIERLRLLHQYGIWMDINIIVGMPHETPEDVQETLDFLVAAKDYYDICVVKPFRLESSAVMGLQPEKYGIVRLGNVKDQRGYYRLPFDEVEGLPFEAQFDEGMRRHKFLQDELAKLGKGYSAYTVPPFGLLFWLYGALGHAGKSEIRRIVYELIFRPPDAMALDPTRATPASASSAHRPAPAAAPGAPGAPAKPGRHDPWTFLDPFLADIAARLTQACGPILGKGRIEGCEPDGRAGLKVKVETADGLITVGLSTDAALRDEALVKKERFWASYYPSAAPIPAEALAAMTRAIGEHVAVLVGGGARGD